MKKIIALALTLVLTLMSCTTFASEIPVDITGLWYAWLADGASTLFLRADGTGSLQMGEAAYTVTWQQNNGVLTMNQGGALVDGVYDEGYISLAIGSGNLIFLREDAVPLPLDSDITGTWRAPMLGGDSLLTLNADGSAVLQLGPDAVPLTWTHEGASVILYQDGYPIECTYDGVFISIFLGEGSICFMPDNASSAESAQ